MSLPARMVPLIVAATLAAATVGCSSSGGSPGAFSFATGSLCDWITEREIAKFVAAEYEWDAQAGEVRPERPGCLWDLAGDEFGFVEVSDVRQWAGFDGDPVDPREWFSDIVDFGSRPPGSMLEGAAIAGHPALTNGVLVMYAGFGQFVFWVPPRDEYLGFAMAVPEDGGVDDFFFVDVERQRPFFAVADRVIRELGWTGG